MRIGVSTYTFAWATGDRKYAQKENLLPLPKLVDKAASLPGVEILQACDHSGAELLTPDERKALREQAAAAGITVQAGTKGIEPDHLRLFLRTAKDLGSDLVRTILPTTGRGSGYAEAEELLREVLPEFEKSGILLSLENHDRNLSIDLRRLVDKIASPVFGICLDTVNSFGIGEDSIRVLDNLAPVTNCFHAKDYTIGRIDYGLGFLIQGTPTGKGMLNIPDIVERFKRHGTDPDIIVELWTPFEKDIEHTRRTEDEWAAESVAYLRRLLGV